MQRMASECGETLHIEAVSVFHAVINPAWWWRADPQHWLDTRLWFLQPIFKYISNVVRAWGITNDMRGFQHRLMGSIMNIYQTSLGITWYSGLRPLLEGICEVITLATPLSYLVNGACILIHASSIWLPLICSISTPTAHWTTRQRISDWLSCTRVLRMKISRSVSIMPLFDLPEDLVGKRLT